MGLSISGHYSSLQGFKASRHDAVNIWTEPNIGSYLSGESTKVRLWATGAIGGLGTKINFSFADKGNLPSNFTVTDDPDSLVYGYISGTFNTVTQNTTYTFSIRATQDFTSVGGPVLTTTKQFIAYQNVDNIVYYWAFNKSVNSHVGTPDIGSLAFGGSNITFSSFSGSSKHFLRTMSGFAYGGPTWSVSTTLDFLNNSDFTIETYFLADQGYCSGQSEATLFSINGNQFAIKLKKPAADGLPTYSVCGHSFTSLDATNFGGAGIYTDQWNHIAVVRKNNILKIYINGVSNGASIDLTGKTLISHTGAYSSITRFNIGANDSVKVYDAGQDAQVVAGTFDGFFSEFKIYNKAVYSTNFGVTWGHNLPSSWGSQL